MDNSQNTVKNKLKSIFQKNPQKLVSDKRSDKLLTRGNNYLESGEIDNALKYYIGAYNAFQVEKDIIGEGYALTGIGFIHEKRKNYGEAKKYYKLSLKKFREAKDKVRSKKVSKLLADLLLRTADLGIGAEKFEEAEDSYIGALKCYKDSKDIIGEAYALTGLGIIYGKYGQYEESREYYEKALKKFKKAKDFKRAGIISKLIANTYEIQEALEDALVNYKISLELFRNIEAPQREAEIREYINLLQDKKSKQKASKKQILFLSTYLILVCIAEIITAYYSVRIGLIMHISILSILLIHSSMEKSYTFSNLLRCMMLVPIIRILGLTIPLMQLKSLYWFPVISIPLFAALFTIIKTQKINRKNLGLTLGNSPLIITIPLQLLIAATGIIIGFIEYQILHPDPIIPYFNIGSVIVAGIILLISTGFIEELLFRGIIQKNSQNIIGTGFGILYTSLIFTSLHISWNSIFDLILVLGVSLFYGYMFQKTESLVGITLSHGISNSVLFLIMPFVVF